LQFNDNTFITWFVAGILRFQKWFDGDALDQGILKGDHCTVDLLFDLESVVWQLTIFVLYVKQTIPNQSNRSSMVELCCRYFGIFLTLGLFGQLFEKLGNFFKSSGHPESG